MRLVADMCQDGQDCSIVILNTSSVNSLSSNIDHY